jgi:hypothetical protein
MTPAAHTTYSLCLLMALVSLRLWIEYRHQCTHRFRTGTAAALASGLVGMLLALRVL